MTTFTRITKTAARKRLFSGLPVAFCPVKLRPGFPFAPHCTISPEHAAEKVQRAFQWDECGPVAPALLERAAFDSIVREFCWYNANSHETGTYPAYYVESV